MSPSPTPTPQPPGPPSPSTDRHLNARRGLGGLLGLIGLGLLSFSPLAPAGDAERSVTMSIEFMRAELRRLDTLRGRPVQDLDKDDLARLRAGFAYLSQQLAFMHSAQQRMAADSAPGLTLKAFVQRWQDEAALEGAILAAPGRRNPLESELHDLARRFPAGLEWRTPFPLFRP